MRITINNVSNISYEYPRGIQPSFKESGYKSLVHSSSSETGLSWRERLRMAKMMMVMGADAILGTNFASEEIAKAASEIKSEQETHTEEKTSYKAVEDTTAKPEKVYTSERSSHKSSASSSRSYIPSYESYHSYISSAVITVEETILDTAEKLKTQINTTNKIQELTTSQTQEAAETDNELIEARKIYKGLLKQYRELCGEKECDRKFIDYWHSWELPLLKTRTADLREEISYQEMVQKAAKALRRGPNEYVSPNDAMSFDLYNLAEIIPDSRNGYTQELNRICAMFLKNSSAADNALVAFNNINKTYAQEAAKGIKEVFALHKDKRYRMLERIPKLGLIPKALRVSDQIKLTKCIMKDYEELTEKYVEGGISPFMKKYNEQYRMISAFVNESRLMYSMYNSYTDKIMKIIDDARQKRLQAEYKLMNSYSSNGMNISNMCHKVERKGMFDLARKTVLTFASFF